MKSIFFLVLGIAFCASLAIAQPAATAAATSQQQMTVAGYIVDNACVAANKDKIAEFAKTHTKECAIANASTGYSMVAGDKVAKFDKESNAKIEEFLKKPDSKPSVKIVAKSTEAGLSLISIENLKE